MDWNTEVTKSTFDTDTTLKGYQEGRSRSGNGSSNLSFGGYSQSNNAGSGALIGAGIGGSLGGVYGAAIGAGIGSWIGSTQTTGYDVVGIKGSEVENMRSAIREYVSNVQKVVEKTLETNDEELNKGVRGAEVKKAVNQYIDKVKLYCQNVTSGLLVFSDKLADIGNAWTKATETMASNVGSSTSSFSEGSTYSESVQYTGGSSVASGVAAGAAAGAAAVGH